MRLEKCICCGNQTTLTEGLCKDCVDKKTPLQVDLTTLAKLWLEKHYTSTGMYDSRWEAVLAFAMYIGRVLGRVAS